MRIVRREEKELVTRGGDQRAGIFEGERCEANLPADVIARSERQLAHGRIRLVKRPARVIEAAQEFRDPPGTELDRSTLEDRKPLEDAVVDESGEEHLWREGNHHEVLEAKVLTPAEPVGRALAAVVIV